MNADIPGKGLPSYRPALASDELPFNFSAVVDRFVWGKPSDPLPGSGRFWILVSGGGLVVDMATGVPALPKDPLPFPPEALLNVIPLGLLDGIPLVMASLAPFPLPDRFTVEQYNVAGDLLPPDFLTLGGIASAILTFDRTTRFCGSCGEPIIWLDDEWAKRCPACGSLRYPATSPCAIVLVQRGDKILLVRKPGWPRGRYSLVAGFLSLGESLEECARREVWEETGISIGYPEYLASQYWPFPAQLMTGFRGTYLGGEIQCADRELEDARWYPIDALPENLPGQRSIARRMIDLVARR